MLLLTQAGQGVDAVNVHRAGSADTLSATSAECEGRVDLVLDADEGIEHHGSGLVQVQGVGLHPWLLGRLIWVPSVDVESLDLCRRSRRGLSDCGGLRLGRDCSCESATAKGRPEGRARRRQKA